LPEPERNPQILDLVGPQRHREVEIRCLGVWDTVGALGIPGTRLCSSAYAFHETSLGDHVRYAFQALAIDERRGNFQPAVWAKRFDDPDQVLEQVWFPGVHSDIGGGYQEHGLSDATLQWMLSRLQFHGLVDFDPHCVEGAVNRYHAETYARGKLHDSRSYFWKTVACPIPRPVGITDDSEKVHVSAIDRMRRAGNSDSYAIPSRQAWLGTLPAAKIVPTSPFEQRYVFDDAGCGMAVRPIVRPRRGLCDWAMRRLFGQA
jgi:type VI secretion system (T6SS) phospholipase Tle1-like effector